MLKYTFTTLIDSLYQWTMEATISSLLSVINRQKQTIMFGSFIINSDIDTGKSKINCVQKRSDKKFSFLFLV